MSKINEIVDYYLELIGKDNGNYNRHLRPAKQLLEICDGSVELARQKLDKTKEWMDGWGGEDWKIETVIKRFLEV